MARVRGVEAHRRRLKNIRGAAMVRQVTQAVFIGAQDIANDAALSITKGATSGKNHVAAPAGEPPNADTHVLDRNIEAVSTGPLKAEASSNAPYSAAHEFGYPEGNLPARPFMAPAAKRMRQSVTDRVVSAVNRVLRRSGAG